MGGIELCNLVGQQNSPEGNLIASPTVMRENTMRGTHNLPEPFHIDESIFTLIRTAALYF